MSILMNMMTRKPRALVRSARAPGTRSFANAFLAASGADAPPMTSSRQVLVICTACEQPIEKMRNGTRIERGSMPSPTSGSAPSNHSTGNTAQIRPTAVSIVERVYQRSNTAVIVKASNRNRSTPRAPSVMSPTALAKPMILTSVSAS